MSGTRWEWRDGGSGPGHMQRVAANGVFSRTQLAYRAYLDHAIACEDCEYGETRCEKAYELWRAYKDAQR